jgi:ABC-type Fe3+ transport system substrate-binding protein
MSSLSFKTSIKGWVKKSLISGTTALFIAAGSIASAAEVNIYSAREENLIKPILDRYTAQTGTKINLITGGADELIKRLELEGVNSPADLLLTVDTYYLAGMLKSTVGNDKRTAESVGVFWPNQQDRGAHINISGAGVTKSAKNTDAAIQLLEFMVSEEAQHWYADANDEFPVRAGIPASEILQSWGAFKADDLPLEQLGVHNSDAVRLMDRAGWK